MSEINQYSFNRYVPESRWQSYWHQIDRVLVLNPKSVLVIGVGDSLVIEYLKKYILEVKTLDIEADLSPDILASVEKIPLPDNSFDLVLCAEVLEHLPFEKFGQCLIELKRVTKKNVVLSLPHFGPAVKFKVKLPLFKELKLAIKIPISLKHQFTGQHYWEIGKRNYSASKIKKIISSQFKVISDFVPFGNQYHHFYILEK